MLLKLKGLTVHAVKNGFNVIGSFEAESGNVTSETYVAATGPKLKKMVKELLGELIEDSK